MRNQEQQKKTSTEGIHEIKKIAGQVSKSAEVIHELPPGFVLTTPNPSHVYSFQDLETKIVKDRHLNQLAVAWIAARAKARNNEQLTKRLGVLRKTWMLNQTSGNMFNERA